jgi:protein gp37
VSENSKIEWTDHTFNPWEGCQKVGPGCDNCYAETRNARFAGGTAINWGPGAPRRRTSASNWRKPLQWNKTHAEFFAKHGRRQRVFCASLADVFDNAVDPVWRRDLFDLIELTPNLNWLLLTKRIGNVFEMVARARSHDWLAGRDNVWLGATIVNQLELDRDIPKLLEVPARIRFLSMEPLLGPVTFRWASWIDHDAVSKRDGKVNHLEGLRGIDWVIVGGESGHGARPMHPEWARALRDQCAEHGVPFLFKQWGEWAPGENCAGPLKRTERVADWWDGEWEFSTMTPGAANGMHRDDEPVVYRCGKNVSGRMLDGRTHDEFPRGTR